MNECPFCSIIAGESPARIVLETEHFVAFPPLDQEVPEQTLIVSKEHFSSLIEARPTIGASLIEISQRLLSKLAGQGYTGFNLLNANGLAAQQSVMHLHFHFIPRKDRDGIDSWPVFFRER